MAQLDEVKKIIRSLLVSAPVKVTVRSLNYDYKALEGRPIPFTELGYNSLLHLLHSLPDVLRVNGSSFDSEVTLIITQKVAHVSDMVMKQRMPTKGRKALAGRKSVMREPPIISPATQASFNYFKNRSAKKNQANREPQKPASNGGVFNEIPMLSPFPKPLLSAAKKVPPFTKHIPSTKSKFDNPSSNVSSNNLNNSNSINCDDLSPSSSNSVPNCERVPSLSKHMPQNIVSGETKQKENLETLTKFERLKLRRSRNNDDLEILKLNCVNKSEEIISLNVEKTKIPLEIQNKLKSLIKHHPSGIQCDQLLSLYKKMYMRELDYQKFGFNRLINFCLNLDNIFHCEPESDYDYKIYDKDNVPVREKKPKPMGEMVKTKILAKTVDLSQIKPRKSKDWDKYVNNIPDDTLRLGEVVENNSLNEYVIGETMQIVISEIYTPNKFWIYKNNGYLNDMMNSMQCFYRENKANYLIPEFLIEVGLYCVVHTLKEFQRALVVDLLHELGGFVKVYLIDYGTLANLTTDKLWFLSKEFSKLPAQAIETSLAEIEPKDENVWTEQSILRFKDMVTSKQIFAKILDKKEQTLSVHISVMKMPLKTLNDLLVKEGYAKYTTDCKLQVSTSSEISVEDTNPRRKLIERIRLKNQSKEQ